MAAVNDVPQLVDKKGGSCAGIALKLEPRKFNKWKKRMLCYLARMEPYYLKCNKDGPFQPKIAEGDAKPESQWTPGERRVVIQDQRLKSIIMSCLPDDIWNLALVVFQRKKHGLTWFTALKDFQENSDDEVDERSSEEYLRDLDVEYQKRALLANSKQFIKEETTSQTFQPKNKGLVAEIFNWDEEEVTQVKVLMALADDELTVRKNHARNDEWVNITMRKVNTLLSMDEDVDWKNYLKYINIDLKFFKEQ
nr:retrovirus-related Pol polyprotein from transposon TNT 1-94 [Tanacetum cinerariifolium]